MHFWFLFNCRLQLLLRSQTTAGFGAPVCSWSRVRRLQLVFLRGGCRLQSAAGRVFFDCCCFFQSVSFISGCWFLQGLQLAQVAAVCSSATSNDIFFFHHSNEFFYLEFIFSRPYVVIYAKLISTLCQACLIFFTSKHIMCRCRQLVPLAHQDPFLLSRFYEKQGIMHEEVVGHIQRLQRGQGDEYGVGFRSIQEMPVVSTRKRIYVRPSGCCFPRARERNQSRRSEGHNFFGHQLHCTQEWRMYLELSQA